MRLIRTLLVLLLTAGFLLGQHAAWAHEMSHFGQAPAGEKQSPHESLFCDQCLAHAALHVAVAPGGWALSALEHGFLPAGSIFVSQMTREPLPRVARSPPSPA